MLRKRGVPKSWLRNRIDLFHGKIAKIIKEDKIGIVILGGDLFDKAPTVGEVGMFLDFINLVCNELRVPVYMIAGNHEATTKYETFLEEFKAIEANNFKLITKQEQIKFKDVYITFMSYAEVKAQAEPLVPITDWKNIMVSHVCGDLPPHVTEEYPIDKFNDYDLTLLGDLHHFHKSITGINAWYPGSPYSITFAQSAKTNKYGVFIIDTEDDGWIMPQFVSLDLPQLVAIKCTPSELDANKAIAAADTINHYKIEVEGTPAEMASIKDKTIVKKSVIMSEETVNLTNMTKDQELEAVLEHMAVGDIIEGVMKINATITY